MTRRLTAPHCIILAVAFLIVFGPRLHAQETGPENLVLNGDFSRIKDGKPVLWVISGDPQTVTQILDVVYDNGNPCAKLTCTRCEGKGGWTHAMIAQIGVKLEQGRSYEFSCRVRGEGIKGRNVSVMIQDTTGWHPCGLQTELPLADSWNTYQRVFKASRSTHQPTRLQFWYNEPGTLYLDDVSIVEIGKQRVEFADVVPDVGAKNLIPNGSFEAGRSGWSSLSDDVGWSNLASLHGKIETSGAVHGENFLRIPLGDDNTPVLYFDYFEPTQKRQLLVLAANIGWVRVDPSKEYTLSCSMRSSVDGINAVLGVRTKDPEKRQWGKYDHRRSVKLTRSWQRYMFTFKPKHPYVFVTLGPDLKTEVRVDVDIDAVQLEEGDRATEFEPRTSIEIGVEPSEPAGIFSVGQPAYLHIRAYNQNPTAQKVCIDFEVTDFFDKPASLSPVTIDVPAGSSSEQKVDLPPDWKGYYRVLTTCHVNGKTLSQEICLAVVPPRSADDSILGINHAFVTPYLIQLAKKAGVTWYRDWSLKWQHIEPAPGEFHWEAVDPQINRVLQEGVHLMSLLPPFPSVNWISEAPADLPTQGYPGVRLAQAWAPKDPQKLGDFVAQAVSRYKDRVQVWEFLNEPIYTTYALPGKEYELLKEYGGKRYECTDYVRLLETASNGMKRSDPKCRVMGGIGGGPDTSTKEVIEAGCLRHVDIFNLHTYPGNKSPEGFVPAMDKLLALMDTHGGRKPIWITEFSYYGTDKPPRRPFIPDSSSGVEERLLANERECAEFTIRYFAIMMARGAEKIFIHSGTSGSVNDPELGCCIFGYGGVPRRIFPALAVFTELMGSAPKYSTERLFGETGYCFAFETGKKAVLVLWTSDRNTEIKVGTGAISVECLDLMGRNVPAESVKLTTTPVYLVGPAGKAKELVSLLKGSWN